MVVDPKTASSCPSVSDHQTEVRFNDTQQPCSGNPECNTSHQQNLEKSPKRRRVEQDYEDEPKKIEIEIGDKNEGKAKQCLTEDLAEELAHFFSSSEEEEEDLICIERVGSAVLLRGQCSNLKGAHGAGDETMN